MTTTQDLIQVDKISFIKDSKYLDTAIESFSKEFFLPVYTHEGKLDRQLLIALELADGHLSLVARKNHEVVGFLGAISTKHLLYEGVTRLTTHSVYTSKELSSKERYKVLQVLLDRFEEEAEAIGVNYVEFSSNARFDVSKVLYKRDYAETSILYSKKIKE